MNTQKELHPHVEELNVRSIWIDRHKKEKLRESSKHLKIMKMRNALGRHTYGIKVRSIKSKNLFVFYIFLSRYQKEILFFFFFTSPL